MFDGEVMVMVVRWSGRGLVLGRQEDPVNGGRREIEVVGGNSKMVDDG